MIYNSLIDQNLALGAENGESFSSDVMDMFGMSAKPGGQVVFAPQTSRFHANATGDETDNTLTGTALADNLFGLGGNDTLIGLAGKDHLYGGTGDDTLDGGSGDDELDGGTGADVMIGGTGSDLYHVDDAGDVITELAGEGYDTVNTTLNTFFFEDYANVDRVNFSGTGDFLAQGDSGNNRLHGFHGDDTFLLDAGGADIFSGGNGSDTFDASASVNGIILHLNDQSLNAGDIAGDFFASIENFYGSDTAADYMEAGAGRARFFGGGGDDVLIGGDTMDYLVGGANNDTLTGGASTDIIHGGEGDDILTGGADEDTFVIDETEFGIDMITDFEAGSDGVLIGLHVATSLADFTITGLGTNEVTLTLNDGTGNNILTIQSLTPLSLQVLNIQFGPLELPSLAEKPDNSDIYLAEFDDFDSHSQEAVYASHVTDMAILDSFEPDVDVMAFEVWDLA